MVVNPHGIWQLMVPQTFHSGIILPSILVHQLVTIPVMYGQVQLPLVTRTLVSLVTTILGHYHLPMLVCLGMHRMANLNLLKDMIPMLPVQLTLLVVTIQRLLLRQQPLKVT